MTDVLISGDSRVSLHDLHFRAEKRAEGEEWVVGRVDTGDFIAVPTVAVDVLRLLGDALTIDQTRNRIRHDQGRDVNVSQFVANLVALGFVTSIDDRPVPGPAAPKATLPWLRPEHVRWVLTWPVAVVLASTTVAAVIALRWTPEVTPGYHDLLWTVHTSLLLAGNAAIAWSIILLHELAHLVTARALGVPGRMSFGTRLQFLVAQTDVSGVWASPRWKRMTVYVSGIAVNVVVAATAILVRVAVGPHTADGRLWAAVAVLSLLFIPPQLLLFMRTDLYFVLQDLTGCRNLYADGSAYVRWWGQGVRYAITRAGARPGDPGAAIPAQERRALFGYALVLLLGTMACLAVAVTVTLPVALSVLAMAAKGLFTDGHVQARIDALVTTAIVGGYWMLWCRAWWQRHGRRVGIWWGRVGTRASRLHHQGQERSEASRKGGESHGGDHHSKVGQGRDDN